MASVAPSKYVVAAAAPVTRTGTRPRSSASFSVSVAFGVSFWMANGCAVVSPSAHVTAPVTETSAADDGPSNASPAYPMPTRSSPPDGMLASTR